MASSLKPQKAVQALVKNTSPSTTNSLARQLINLSKEHLPAVEDEDKIILKITKSGIEATVTTEQGTQRFEETPAYAEMSISPEHADREDKIASAQKLRDKGLTQAEIAKRVGRSQAWVAINTEKAKKRR